MQFETVIEARVPRMEEKESGSTHLVATPWAEEGRKWTLAFECFCVQVLQATQTLSGACGLLGIGWSTARQMMERAVERGMLRREEDEGEVLSLGIDEKSCAKGHEYSTVVSDLKGRRVLEVYHDVTRQASGRDAMSGRRALEAALPREAQRRAVQAVAMDMSAAYEASVRMALPAAVVVFDKFHVVKMLHEAIEKTRRSEAAQMAKQGDASLLKGTRYWWLKGLDKLSNEVRVKFEALRRENLRTSKAWNLKEDFMPFWQQENSSKALEWFNAWSEEVAKSKVPSMLKVARSLKRHLPGLLAFFTHPISNAMAEGFNSKIQVIKSSARGFRNPKNWRIAILFHMGKLHLSPYHPHLSSQAV
jgi:transposase